MSYTNLLNGRFDQSPKKLKTAYNWEAEKNRKKDFFDDGTISFFWRAHTITVLIVFSCILFYVAVIETEQHSTDYNVKRGAIAVVSAFILFGVIHTPDGPFRRPHPAFWRFILCLSILYELCLVFLLFQGADDARQWLKMFDDELGVPLPEKAYGEDCSIYDTKNVSDPYHNVRDKMDGFVTVHFFGWWLKTLIIRDFWLCNIMSFMFEVLEYTLEHQLPNFSECWWDHWIMDFLGCNLAGIYLGMKTLNYLSMKPYRWSSLWKITGYKGKLKRIALQFTPHLWTEFDWRPTTSLKRWLAVLGIVSVFLLAELNTFYLKFVLWVPPPHFLCLGRLVFFLFMGATALRETFQYLDDPECKRFGRQSWIILAVIITEFLIVIKFDWDTVTKPLPSHITVIWLLFLLGLVAWTFWHFFIKPTLLKNARKQSSSRLTRSSSNSLNGKNRTSQNGSTAAVSGNNYNNDEDCNFNNEGRVLFDLDEKKSL